jgi:hypothetical protein
MADNVDALVTAGLVKAEFLTAQDRALIDGLSNQEIRTLIDVARRLYPEDPSAAKLIDLESGVIRICIPL